MNQVFALIVGVVLLAGIVAGGDKEGKGKKDWKNFKFECKGTEIKFDDDMKTAWQECHKELVERKKSDKKDDKKDDEGECKHVKPDACFAACKMEKLKAVKDGKLDMTVINSAVEKAFPKDVQDDVKAAYKKCAEAITEKLDKTSDCAPFAKFGKCQMESTRKICKNKNDDEA